MASWFKKNSAIGIDISDHSIEVLQLSRSGEVMAFGRIILPEGIVLDGRILKKDILVKKLQEILGNTKPRAINLSGIQAIVSLPESKTFIHHIRLPNNLSKEKLEKKIYTEAEKNIPHNVSLLHLDYLSVPARDKNFQHIAFVGVLREVANAYVEVLRLVGIETVILDAESASLGRSLVKPFFLKKSVAVVDIGARTTNLNFFAQNGLLYLSVTLPIAGNHFTKAIAKKLNISVQDAESMKKKFGFDSSKKDNRVLSILQERFQKIITEIKSAISYFEKHRGHTVEHIVIAGGSALLPHVAEYLSINLEKKVTLADPLKSMKGSELLRKEHSPVLFANVTGLALRGARNMNVGINLQKFSEHKQKKSQNESHALKTKKIDLSVILQKVKKSRLFIVIFLFFSIVFLGLVLYKFVFAPIKTSKISPSASLPIPEQHIEPLATEITIDTTTPTSTEENLITNEEVVIIEQESEKISEKRVLIQQTPTGWLNVRTGSGTDFEALTRVYPEENYLLLEESEEWYKIKIDDATEGWIFKDYAERVLDEDSVVSSE